MYDSAVAKKEIYYSKKKLCFRLNERFGLYTLFLLTYKLFLRPVDKC